MIHWPTDDEIPEPIREALRRQAPGSDQQLVEWLYIKFAPRVPMDRLHNATLRFLMRIRAGKVPTKPVGLFEVILFGLRLDSRKRERIEAKVLVTVRRDRSQVTSASPFVEAMRKDLLDRLARTVFFGRLRDAAPAVVWTRLHGLSFAEIAELLANGGRERWTPGRARRVYLKAISIVQAELAPFD